MSTPESTPANGLSLAHVLERVVEVIHYTSEHREDGKQAQFYRCPHDPCSTWRAWIRESGWMG